MFFVDGLYDGVMLMCYWFYCNVVCDGLVDFYVSEVEVVEVVEVVFFIVVVG